MLFGHLLSGCGQMFSDIRTYWSPEAVKRVTGKELTGMAKTVSSILSTLVQPLWTLPVRAIMKRESPA